MVDIKMQLAFLVVLVTGVRSQDTYGSPATSVVNPASVSAIFNGNSVSSNTILDNPSGFSPAFGSSIRSSISGGSTFLPSFTPPKGSSSISSSGYHTSISTFDSPLNSLPPFSSGTSFSSSSNSFPKEIIFSPADTFSSQSSFESNSATSTDSSFITSNSFSDSSSSLGTSSNSVPEQSFNSPSGFFPSQSSFGFNQNSGISIGSSVESSNSFSERSSSQTSFGSTKTFSVSSSNSFAGGSASIGSSGRTSGSSNVAVPVGVDFSQATRTEDGRLCVIKQESVETLSKDPILECKHKDVKKCHYTYITYFKPAQEEACEENYEKSCQITFRQEAVKETVRKCYRPLEKLCHGQGKEVCKTVYESSCTTKYIEKGPGKVIGDTKCEKLPDRICGAGCVTEEGPEECHDKTVDTLVDVPEETCDLNPQKTCRLVTKLVPSLKPKQECTTVPQETCNLKFTSPQRKQKPLRKEWCLEDEPSPSYDPGTRSGRRSRP